MNMPRGGGGRDDAQFEAIYRQYYAVVRRYLHRCGVADDDLDDLTQLTFTRFYDSMDTYRGEAVWGFLEKTALNVLRNKIRERKTGKRSGIVISLDDPDFTSHEPSAPALDYARQQEEAVQRQQVRAAIDQLTQAQQQPLKLWLEGLQYNEIAEVLRISLDAVRSRIRDAKRILCARLGVKPPEDES